MLHSLPRIDVANSVLSEAKLADFAYQPIVSMTSLRAHGFEALARLRQPGPPADVLELLDAASPSGELKSVQRELLANAIGKFSRYSGATDARLFCNVDNRVFEDPEAGPAHLVGLIQAAGLQPANVCLEISERHSPNCSDALASILEDFLKSNIRIAIDDFGQGFSGLQTLLNLNPHYIKIDQQFVQGLSSSVKQQTIVAKVIALAHSLGYLVIGEGVETEADFRALRGLGCDLAQGYLIARPNTDLSKLRLSYDRVVADNRRDVSIPPRIAELMVEVEPLEIGASLLVAVDRFKGGMPVDFIPVVDPHGNVHGAVYEHDLRYFLVNEYGPALLSNKGLARPLGAYIRRCPVSEATAPQDALIDSYVVSERNDGIVLTLDARYRGVLTNNAMLRLAAERDVALARDQNPLTFLPGNFSIQRHLTEALASSEERTVVFFDFDHFKAFNDTYGFALGDRALLMFAELLLAFRHRHRAFVGHIGGDDFFASIPATAQESQEFIRSLTHKFRADVESLYLFEDRAQGGLWAKDRFGEQRFVPLLRASAAVLPLPLSRTHITGAAVVAALSEGKTQAKRSQDGLALLSLPPTGVAHHLDALSERLSQLRAAGTERGPGRTAP